MYQFYICNNSKNFENFVILNVSVFFMQNSDHNMLCTINIYSMMAKILHSKLTYYNVINHLTYMHDSLTISS